MDITFDSKGNVLCIIEAMKLFNEIESETDGRIVKILAESTKSVEYGQALFLIDPAPYQAAVDSAKAALAKAQANEQSARLKAKATTGAGTAKSMSKPKAAKKA